MHGADPSPDELSLATGLTRTQLESLLAAERRQRSTHESVSAELDPGSTLGDMIVDPSAEQAYQQVLDKLEHRSVRDLSERLEPRERTVIQAHYGLTGEAQALSEIASGLGLTAERVRQIEVAALARLRPGSARPSATPRLERRGELRTWRCGGLDELRLPRPTPTVQTAFPAAVTPGGTSASTQARSRLALPPQRRT